MVQRSIDSVNTNNIGAKFLENRNITLAASFVCEGIGESSIGSGVGVNVLLICYTTDEEFGTVLIEEMGSLVHE